MLTREEMQVLIEREGIAEFFNVIDSFYLEATECTIYELETEYYAAMFRIFPSAYAGPALEEIIANSLTCGLPENSVVQFHQLSTKNIEDDKKNYDEVILKDLDEVKLRNPQMLKELHDAHMIFLEKHTEITVFEKTKLAYYIRDFLNTVTIMIPMRSQSDVLLTVDDLIPTINKFKGSMYSLFPININEHQYIRIIRELLTPYNPQRDAYREPSMDIRDHFTDLNSTLQGIGKGVIKLSSSDKIEFKGQEGSFREEKENFTDKMLRTFKSAFGLSKDEDIDARVETEKSKKAKTDDPYYVKVLSKKMFPEYADLNSITDLTMDYFDMNVQQQMPLTYVIAVTVVIENSEKIISNVKNAAIWNKSQLDKIGKLGEYFPELKMRAEEADDVINIIDRKGDLPMKLSWTMLLYSQNKEALEYNTAITKANFQKKAFLIQEEDLIATSVFMYALPMKFDEIYQEWSKRFQTVFKTNVASVVPVGTDSRGFGNQAVVQLFGRNGQPQAFDLYDPTASNKNAVIIAPSGKGKSFFTQRLVWSYLKQGAKIRIVDSGHSYKHLCDLLGGQYITFPDNSDVCLNPFTEARIAPDGRLNEDEISNITNLVAIMAGYDLSENKTNADVEIINTLSSYISSAVTNAFDIKGKDAGMEDVGYALNKELNNLKENAKVDGDIRDGDIDSRLPRLIVSLGEFTNPSGMYYSYVNGPANITFNSNLVVLDMDDLNAKQKRFKDFVLSTITNTIEREFYKERHIEQRKLFFIDEAMHLLDGKAGAVILKLYQRARKMRGSIITITQSINHFYLNDNIKGIFENAYWRLFLEQDPSAITTALEEKKLIIDDYAFELLKTVRTKIGEYSEVMIMTQTGDLMIGKTLATPVEFYVSTQDEAPSKKAAKIARDYNTTEVTARLAMGFAEMNKSSVEDELIRLSGYEDKAIAELLEEKVEDVA